MGGFLQLDCLFRKKRHFAAAAARSHRRRGRRSHRHGGNGGHGLFGTSLCVGFAGGCARSTGRHDPRRRGGCHGGCSYLVLLHGTFERGGANGRSGSRQGPHPQVILRQSFHDGARHARHEVFHVQFIVSIPAGSPVFQTDFLARFNLPVRHFIGFGAVFGWIRPKGLELGDFHGGRSQRIHHNCHERIAVRIFQSLPLQLGCEIGL
mmetsp:Transcript_12124/g.29456  ORF Transcript_12124/g.29456 Transcript_12124/m.29456 type:complete len:207 (+) Transcript_12124:635-1255(+)